MLVDGQTVPSNGFCGHAFERMVWTLFVSYFKYTVLSENIRCVVFISIVM